MFDIKTILKSKIWMKENLGEIDIPVVNHCNLNCASCDHFAPLAEKHFYKLENYIKNLDRLKALLKDKKIYRINLMGGEPLLHPQLIDFCRVTREKFSDTNIFITTNGILLPQWEKENGHILKKLNIRILVTEYNKDKNFYKMNLLKEKSSQKSYQYCNNRNINVLEIIDNVDEEFHEFYSDFPCTQLNENGDYFSCIIPANIEIFNKHFKTKYELIEGQDFVNIFNIDDLSEMIRITQCKKIPFCDYCGKKTVVKWKGSKNDEQEWVEQ